MRLVHLSALLPIVALSGDPIALLQAKELNFEAERGYLASVLKELKIDPSSQMLVFSKSSLQGQVSPKNPRAIYFNENSYVAWIPGAPLLEIMTVDPAKGPQFYSIMNKADGTIRAEDSQCFRCHGRSPVQLIARSSIVAPSGYPRVDQRSRLVGPETPIEERWGGWYVTGTHGTMRHMGNALSTPADEQVKLDKESGANRTDLSSFFDTSKYLTPHSDIVALMVFEHQIKIQNAISAVATKGSEVSIDHLVDVMLGVGEVKLTSTIIGTSGFRDYYQQRYPKDQKGRSLGDLDLRTRLLKFSCSPMVYSAAFQALPQKDAILTKLKARSTQEAREILNDTL